MRILDEPDSACPPLAPSEPVVDSPAIDPSPPTLEEHHGPGFGPVLRNRRFIVLWMGQIFSQLADKIYLVLMIALISSHFQVEADSISHWVSAVMIAFTIPAVLFGSLAGVYVDRWVKKTVLVQTNLWRGALVLTIPPLLWLTGNLTPWWQVPVGFIALLVITFFVSTLTQFFAPAEQTAIPLIVPKGQLLPANSLYTTTMMVLLIVGFAVGEPLLAFIDQGLRGINPSWSFGREILVGGAYAIAGLILLCLKTGETAASLKIERPHVFQDILDGIQYLRQNHRVRNAMVQLIILFCVFAALAVLAVPLTAGIPGLKPEQFGFLLAAGGVGMAIGAFILGHWGQQFRPLYLTVSGRLGGAIALFSLALFSNHLAAALTSTAALGFFAAFIGVPMQTTIQAETPEAMRGKVFGLQNNAVNIALSLPLALAGVAESIWGLSAVLNALALLVLIGGLLSWTISRKGVLTSTSTNVTKR
ncbi:MFS transporter [Spirulina sp. CCNP1310]|uniref:MFS transporter n=1 Tax=Spirulina sp. CCNP1310 TaxID=3110249 RepID=UPI002B21E2CF|nr:MFS transporter [Spirulina sp. CCNP1310]MEA5419087.1 MFS transporter [Spirulina sp. CCNP1310]